MPLSRSAQNGAKRCAWHTSEPPAGKGISTWTLESSPFYPQPPAALVLFAVPGSHLVVTLALCGSVSSLLYVTDTSTSQGWTQQAVSEGPCVPACLVVTSTYSL